MQTPPPWSNNTAQLPERLAILSLPDLNDAPGALHHHIRLWVYVDGQPVVVPAEHRPLTASRGSRRCTRTMTTGTVHVESADPNFQPVLGQFMDVWGLYFTPTCLGNACNDGDRQLRVFLNGQQYTGDPTLLPLDGPGRDRDHDGHPGPAARPDARTPSPSARRADGQEEAEASPRADGRDAIRSARGWRARRPPAGRRRRPRVSSASGPPRPRSAAARCGAR